MALFTVYSAEAQSYNAVITLDPIPSKIKTGSTVTFSGQLGTTSGHVIQDATVYIKDDVDFGRDTVIGTVTTDSSGKFQGSWTAKSRSSGAWDFYAVYEGSSNINKARSTTYSIQVSSYYDSSDNSQRSSGSSNSEPTYYSTSITLNRIPSSVYAGDSVTFTGKLTANGKPLGNALVKILEDDPFSPDQRLGYGRTNSNGEFSITWNVSAGLIEVDFDVYAVFDGDNLYNRDRTSNQIISILKYGGSIYLDSFPRSAKVGEVITFSGTLNLDGFGTEGAIVYIKDEDPLTGDDLLATGYVDSSGRFSANWFANYADEDSIVDVYAVFEGSDRLHRLTTCDSGPTKSFGGSCRNTIPIKISGSLPTPPSVYVPAGSEYMELFYSLDFPRTPHVAIVPNSDSYQEVRGHIIPVREGILVWESKLEQKYGGHWDVTFEVVSPNQQYFDSKPDIIVNLDTHDTHAPCYADYYGVSSISSRPSKPIQTIVCSTSDGQRRSNVDVAATAGHEFIHAVGLGHTFNKKGDMMCSVEDNRPTCDGLSSKSKTPSNLNLAAVAQIYGTDGFGSPNNYVRYEQKFALDGVNSNSYTPPSYEYSPPEQKPTNDCRGDDSSYDQTIWTTIKSGWYITYTICSHGPISYSFSTDSEYDGFRLYILPPATIVEDFVNYGNGKYYTCEDYDKSWSSKSNTCNVASGSKIVVHNDGSNAIMISGKIKN